MAGKVEWMLNRIIARGFFSRVKPSGWVSVRLEDREDRWNSLLSQDRFHQIHFRRKMMQEVAQFENRITLLIQLKDGPVLGHACSEI
jgi:hypothetical protein